MSGEDWLLLAILAHILVVLGLLAYLGIVRKESWLSPIVIFVGFLELITLPLPVRACRTLAIEGDVTEYLPQIFPYLAPSLWLVTAGLLIFVTCYYLPSTAWLSRLLPEFESRPGRSPYVLALLLGAVCFVLLSLLARTAGGVLPFILLGYGGTAEMFGKGYLAIGFPWMFVAAMLLLVRYATRRERRDLVLFAIAFAVLTTINLVMGNRAGVLYQAISVVLFWQLAIGRLSLLRLLPIVAASFLALNLVGQLRGSEYANLADVLQRSRASFSSLREAGEVRSGAFYTLTTGEFVVPFETLPMVMRAEARHQIDFFYGSSFVDAFTFLVPNVLWSERPRPLAEWYMRQFYGAGYGSNEGRSFYFLAEGYLNFGPIGVMLLLAVWGYGWGVVGAYVRGHPNRLDPFAALLVALSVAFMFRGIRGVLPSMLIGLPEQSLVPAVLATLILARATASTRTRVVAQEPGSSR